MDQETIQYYLKGTEKKDQKGVATRIDDFQFRQEISVDLPHNRPPKIDNARALRSKKNYRIFF